MNLAHSTWTELDGADPGLLLVPLGATEQHGPHLPLATDTIIAAAIAGAVAARRPGVDVAPAVPYGSSGEHAEFPGTLSIGQAALQHLLVELARSAGGHAGVVLVSAHGGNVEPVTRAVGVLRAEGRRVLAWSPSRYVDLHAGRSETSLLLHLAPELVRLEQAEAGDGRPLTELLPVLRRAGVRAASANGVLGDPTGASAEEGAALLHALAGDLEASLAEVLVGG